MAELNEGERLAIVETQLKNVLDGMAALTLSFTRLEEKLDRREENFVTKPILESELKLRDKEIEGIHKALTQINLDKQTNKTVFPSWIGNVINIAVVIVAIIAIIYSK